MPVKQARSHGMRVELAWAAADFAAPRIVPIKSATIAALAGFTRMIHHPFCSRHSFEVPCEIRHAMRNWPVLTSYYENGNSRWRIASQLTAVFLNRFVILSVQVILIA